MNVHPMRPNPDFETQAALDRGDDIAEFTIMLLDALEIDEIRDAVRERLGIRPAPAAPVIPRTAPSRRGHRR